jgi:hypothetical protein
MRIRSHNPVSALLATARVGGSLGQEVDRANDDLLIISLTVNLEMHEEQIPSCCSVYLNILQSTGFVAHAEHDDSDRRSARMVDNQAPW